MMATVKKARLAAGLTGAEVSTRLKRAVNFVSRVESGERQLSFCELVDYLRACEADPLSSMREILRDC